MSNKGLSFTTHNLQAIYDGYKTATRRTGGLGPVNADPDRWVEVLVEDSQVFFFSSYQSQGHGGEIFRLKLPHRVGDVVPLLEPLRREKNKAVYWDGTPIIENNGEAVVWRWKNPKLPAMFMPSAYYRRHVTIKNIYCHRLNTITDEQAIQEGIRQEGSSVWIAQSNVKYLSPRTTFFGLWESINGEIGESRWAWVMAYEFLCLGDSNEII